MSEGFLMQEPGTIARLARHEVHETRFMAISLPHVDTGDGAIGSMTPQAWGSVARILEHDRLFGAAFDTEATYSLRFLPKRQP